MQNKRRLGNGFVFLLAATGLGLCGYAGIEWQALPHYTDDEIAASAELNLALDHAREKHDAQTPVDPIQIEVQRRAMQAEVRAELAQTDKPIKAWLLAGLALLAIAMARTYLQRRSSV